MNRLERSSVNVFSGAAGFVVPMAVNFIATPLLLHGLGQAAYGLQSLVAVIVGYLTLMDMGMAWPITKLLAEDQARQDSVGQSALLSGTLQLYAAIGLIGMSAIMLLADWLARSVFRVPADLVDQATVVFRLAGIGFLGSVGMSWGSAMATGFQRLDLSYAVSVAASLLGTSIGLGMVYAGHGVIGYVLVRVVVTLMAVPSYVLVARRLLPSFRFSWGVERHTLHRVAGYLGYGTWNRVLGSLVGRLDQALIGIWSGVASAGAYSVVFMISNSLGYMISYMLGFIFPMASELQSLGQMDRLREVYFHASRFIAALAGLIFIPLLVLGDLFLGLWTPSLVGEASSVLRLLALAGFVGTLSASLTNSLMVGLGRMRQFTIYTTTRAVVLAALCLVLIRAFGLEGAGWALLLTCVVDVIYFVVVLRRYLLVSPLALVRVAYLKPILMAGGLGGLALLMRPLATSWLGLGAVGAMLVLAYVTAGVVVGVFGEMEKRAIVGLLQMTVRRLKRTPIPGGGRED